MFSRNRLGLWVGEFLLIALGVLAALAVDRWGEAQRDVRVEGHLLELLAANLAADSMDLDLAIGMVGRRRWLVEELAFALGAHRDAAVPPPVPEGLVHLRPGAWDPSIEPLSVFRSWPDFDLSDDAYREMLSTGSFEVIRSPALRSGILAYYRTAADQGENERRVGQYQEQFEAALAWVGVAVGDTISYIELLNRMKMDQRMSVELRRAASRMDLQIRYYRTIEQGRRELTTLVEEARRAR